MPDERVRAAIANWAPRFVAQGVDYNDFVRTTSGIERWDQWLEAWGATAEMHAELAPAAERPGRNPTPGEGYARAAPCPPPAAGAAVAGAGLDQRRVLLLGERLSRPRLSDALAGRAGAGGDRIHHPHPPRLRGGGDDRAGCVEQAARSGAGPRGRRGCESGWLLRAARRRLRAADSGRGGHRRAVQLRGVLERPAGPHPRGLHAPQRGARRGGGPRAGGGTGPAAGAAPPAAAAAPGLRVTEPAQAGQRLLAEQSPRPASQLPRGIG